MALSANPHKPSLPVGKAIISAVPLMVLCDTTLPCHNFGENAGVFADNPLHRARPSNPPNHDGLVGGVAQPQREFPNMQAIITRYAGPTNTKGGRIIASNPDGKRHVISYPHELNSEQAHRKAAEGLRDKMSWKGELIGGGLRRGYAWVFVS